MALKRIKTNTQKQKTKDSSHTNGKYKIRQTITKITEYAHTQTPINKTKRVQKKKKKKYSRFPSEQRKQKNTNQLKTKRTKAQTGKQNQSKLPIVEQSNENETNTHGEKKK